MAHFANGTYEFVGEVLRSFRALDVSVSEVRELRRIADAVAGGTLDAEQAEAQVQDLGVAFASLWQILNSPVYGNSINTLGVLIAIIALWLAQEAKNSLPHERQQLEAEVAAIYDKHQTSAAIDAMIEEGLRRHSAGAADPVQPEQSSGQPRPTAQARRRETGTTQNRHERRKAASLKRRGDQ